ncbi:uridine phosphorylase [Mesonia hippocampi]|uniref:Uridine phosphorylase n=1 Tax=Mesonia hippocampi TaxID=1628250 RepID=A0A840EYP3_9FLAO|nr:nucleoside phosphorylase [Mesonia hippocampi]MBB4119164.1 uridine phosphorylase [Mesonia hippocampi]
MQIKPSELILNPDGSIYHLNLKPEHLANTIITVGDPDRVKQVTQYFDSIEFSTQKREFHTQTGYYNNQRISVISTGIGTDNIDIVFNELDALVNIDLEKRIPKKQLTSLTIIRVGTSGTIQKNIPTNAFLAAESAVGFDSLLHYYQSDAIQNKALNQALSNQLKHLSKKATPYTVDADSTLLAKFSKHPAMHTGITATNVGFYAPQGRVLRAPLQDANFMENLVSFQHNNRRITNLEMETSGIYGMAKLLGHKALSLNAIVANRVTGEFAMNPTKTVNQLIQFTLENL